MNPKEPNILTCRECGKSILEPDYEFSGGLCSRCHTLSKISEQEKAKTKAGMMQREESWETLCPETYRTNDISQIDENDFRTVTTWKFGKTGLMVVGASGTGKTTSCWHLLHNLYVLQGQPFQAFSEVEFNQHLRGPSPTEFLKSLIKTQVFFLDDLGHISSSPRCLEDLFYVVEKRTSWRRPIIVTTQFREAEFADRKSKTLSAILTRLKRHCQIVHFNKNSSF